MPRQSIAAAAIVLSAFSAQAATTTYGNSPTSGGQGNFPAFDVGQTFTINSASTLANWTFYAYLDNFPSQNNGYGNAIFNIGSWDGTKVTNLLFSSPFYFSAGAALSFDVNQLLAAGTYASYVTTVGVTDPILPFGYLGYGSADNILPGRVVFYNHNLGNGTWEAFDNSLRYSATFTTVSPAPEPETYALLLAGLGAVGFTARQKSKRRRQAEHA